MYGPDSSDLGSGPEAGCCEYGNELLFHKILGISCLIEQSFASQLSGDSSKSGGIRWLGLVAHMGKMRKAYEFWGRKLKEVTFKT